MSTFIERVGEFVSQAPAKSVPNGCLFAARLQVMNTVAAAVAGTKTSAFERVYRVVKDPVAINTAAAAVLEYADELETGSPGPATVPAALVLASDWQKRNQDVFDAIVIGNEVYDRVGRAKAGAQAAAAAAVASRYLGLDPVRAAHAVAISTVLGGRGPGFGVMTTETKLAHAGFAALAGIRAARLAEAGIRGPLDAIGGAPEGLGEVWATELLVFKKHPAVGSHLAAVEALLETDTRAADVESVVVRTNAASFGVDALVTGPADSPVATPYSLRLLVARALFHGRLDGAAFSEPGFSSATSDVVGLSERVTVESDASLPPGGGAVAVRTRDGRTLEARRDGPSGGKGDGKQAQVVEEKLAKELGAPGAELATRLRAGGPIKSCLDYLLEV